MSDETWRGIIIRSIPPTPSWLPVIPSLYTLTSPADIVSILLTHSMILDRGHGNQPSSNPSNTALAAQGLEGCTNPNCKAKMRNTHTTANCYWPGGGKDGQFPPNFGQRSKANLTTLSSHETTQHFALSAWISKQRGVSYPVSGILIEDLNERLHYTSPTIGDNTSLFDTLFNTLDNIHTIDDRSDSAVPHIRNPSAPNFAHDSNQPIPQQTDSEPDKPQPGPDDADRPATLHTPHTEDDSTEVEIHKPTKNDTHLTDSFPERGASHKTAVTPGTDEIHKKLLLAQPVPSFRLLKKIPTLYP